MDKLIAYKSEIKKGNAIMKKKIIYSLILFCLFSMVTITSVFAIDKNQVVGENTVMGSVVTHVDNGIDNTKNGIKDAGEGARNVAAGVAGGVKNVTEHVGNSIKDAGETVSNSTNNAMIYSAETTSLNNENAYTFLGINANTWMWIIIIIIAILIIVLIVKYSDDRNKNHSDNHYDHYKDDEK